MYMLVVVWNIPTYIASKHNEKCHVKEATNTVVEEQSQYAVRTTDRNYFLAKPVNLSWQNYWDICVNGPKILDTLGNHFKH
jgi:hypothetical protein